MPVTEADFSELIVTRSSVPVGFSRGDTAHIDLPGLRHQRYSGLVAELPADLPDLMIQRKMAGPDASLRERQDWLVWLSVIPALRYHVEAGSAEFNRMFRVTTENTTFGAKLIDASMIKWLPSAGSPLIRLHGRNLGLVWGYRLPASGLAAIFDTAKSFTDHIPRQIWTEYRTR